MNVFADSRGGRLPVICGAVQPLIDTLSRLLERNANQLQITLCNSAT